MIPAIFTFIALAAPGGWLAGDVFRVKRDKQDEWAALPIAAAVITPLGALLALIMILETIGETK